MMALLALQEDYANGRIRRERDFRDHDDDWLICRFRFSKAELLDLCTELGPVERETRRNRAGTVPSRSKYRSSPLWGKPAVSEGNVQWVTGMASDPRLFVTVNSPQGALVASKNEVVGQMNFQTEVTGFYRLCLGNHNNQFGGIRVFVNFGVIYEGFEESKREMEEGEMVLNSTLAGIECTMSALGECAEAPESDLPHVASLQLRPHEEREGSLPAPVQLQLRHLVVGDPKPRHPPVRIPAALRPQKTLPHGLQPAAMLRTEHSDVFVIAALILLLLSHKMRKDKRSCMLSEARD
ncbi:uncharacterized protein LOC144521808 isoform X1 [Sander vitreus]